MRYVINIIVFLTVLSVVSLAYCQETTIVNDMSSSGPVVVFGSANEGGGQRNNFLLEQSGDDNPLGNPIVLAPRVEIANTPEPVTKNAISPAQPRMPIIPMVQESLPQNPKISPQETPQIVNKQIQNTLYESGGRIYDIQSIPDDDIKYIQRPNLNPTITTYPAY